MVSGRVVDETGAAVAGARVELRSSSGAIAASASSEPTGNFLLNVTSPGTFLIRAERPGFYVYQDKGQTLNEGTNQLVITLNHLQEFSERINVSASPTVIDFSQPADRKELDNTEFEMILYPASRDYRSALPLIDGVVQDNSGRPHFNGGDTRQTNYTLDGFDISDPVTGNLETRVNAESIQSMDLETSRFSAENGRGSSGALDLKTKMGDDRWRFGGTNFIPGISTEGGLHINKWTPRLEFSGPLAKGRAWFHDGFDGFYNADVVSGLPPGQNMTRGFTTSNLSRFQVNATPANIITGSFLLNHSKIDDNGLTFQNPAETTTNHHDVLYMSSIRDQAYFSSGALLDLGFADTRGMLQDVPQGDALFQFTPLGTRGNYFVNADRHWYRQQAVAGLFLTALHLAGTHQLKFGADTEREAFHNRVLRHAYEVLREDNSVARYVQFAGSPFTARKNLDLAEYVRDRWTPREGLLIEAGLRLEWNEIIRDLEVAPRFSAVWAPGSLKDTKFSAGWGIYYDALNLGLVTNQQNQASYTTFYPPGGGVLGPLKTTFLLNEHVLEPPGYHTASFSAERKLPFEIYAKASYTHRRGSRDLVFEPLDPQALQLESGTLLYALRNGRKDRYDALELSVRHTFAGQYEWFAGYTRSSARSTAAIDYSLENPVFAPQMPGPFAWDTPNRFHTWGWAPLPHWLVPRALGFLVRETNVIYLAEYRTGFPFSIVDQNSFLVGTPNSHRFPAYFDINLAFERKFRLLHYLWAWRFGFNNITNNGNPNAVNNVLGSPLFLTYGRGQPRAFNIRLRLLGRR